MNKTYDWNDPLAHQKVREALQKGEVIAGSSDTVLGLLAPLTQKGVDALNRIKQRSDMPYLLLAATTAQLSLFTNALKKKVIRRLADSFWPGPLTLILPAKKNIPRYLQSQTGGIAMRIPKHEGLLRLLAQTGPLFSTSANISGKPIPTTIDEIDPAIRNHIDICIDDTDAKKAIPSTILDCMGDKIKIMREGTISKQRLQPFLTK